MLLFYRCLTFLFFPLFLILIYLRSIFNKEDRLRFKEKIFSSSFRVNRSDNKSLIWFHAASIGELLSILPLIEEINNQNKNIEFLITTVTLSSANLLKKKISKQNNIKHRFFPLDTEHLSDKFLNRWKPDVVCFVDSEIWPNFLFKIKEKKIPLILINGRITKKTFKRWNIFPGFAKKVFANFDLCLPCSIESKNNLISLHVKKLSYIGNLKFSIKVNKTELRKSNLKILNNFKVWCAASTHEGEELVVLKTHLEIKKKYNNVLTIIIPRHISRAHHIKKLTDKFNLNSQVLNDGDKIDSSKEILIINSFGVLFQYFNYCKNIFIGKSLIKKLKMSGGQNPIEAAKFGCKIYYGPYVYNFKEVYSFLNSKNISQEIKNEFDLSKKLIKNFKHPEKIKDKNIDLLNDYGGKILSDTVVEINKIAKIKNENN